MTKRIRTLMVLAVAAMVLPACTAGFKRPEVELENVTIGSLGLGGGTLLANVRVTNPNRISVRAQDLRYQLYLRRTGEAGDSAWAEFAQGTYDERMELGANETRTFQIPINFSFRDLGGAASGLLQTGRLDYRAVGTVDVRTPFGTREVPFRKTGTFLMTGAR